MVCTGRCVDDRRSTARRRRSAPRTIPRSIRRLRDLDGGRVPVAVAHQPRQNPLVFRLRLRRYRLWVLPVAQQLWAIRRACVRRRTLPDTHGWPSSRLVRSGQRIVVRLGDRVDLAWRGRSGYRRTGGRSSRGVLALPEAAIVRGGNVVCRSPWAGPGLVRGVGLGRNLETVPRSGRLSEPPRIQPIRPADGCRASVGWPRFGHICDGLPEIREDRFAGASQFRSQRLG